MGRREKEELCLSEAELQPVDEYVREWKEKKYSSKIPNITMLNDFDEMAVEYCKAKKIEQESEKNLYDVLSACDDLKIDLIAVKTSTKFIKRSETFPFGPMRSLFTREVRYDGWPAVWEITKKYPHLDGGAGNTNQMQIGCDIVNGVYMKKEGKWYYVTNH